MYQQTGGRAVCSEREHLPLMMSVLYVKWDALCLMRRPFSCEHNIFWLENI